MTYCANISVIDTLIHVGRIKMLHKHTHFTLCVLTACGHWTIDIETELSLIYRPRSTFIYWGLVTPNMVTKYGDKILVDIGWGNCLSSVWKCKCQLNIRRKHRPWAYILGFIELPYFGSESFSADKIFGWTYLYLYLNRCICIWINLAKIEKNPNFCICICIW